MNWTAFFGAIAFCTAVVGTIVGGEYAVSKEKNKIWRNWIIAICIIAISTTALAVGLGLK